LPPFSLIAFCCKFWGQEAVLPTLPAINLGKGCT
jgi:hypothetical protein